MKNNIDKHRKIIRVLMDIIGKSKEINEKVMYFGTDTLLHQSEIHMIVHIAGSSEPYIIGLAKELGITKGAVSQIANRLVKKGMINKNISPDNLSKCSLSLTGKGICAYEHHTELHRSVDEALLKIVEKLDGNTADILTETFMQIDRKLEEYLEGHN